MPGMESGILAQVQIWSTLKLQKELMASEKMGNGRMQKINRVVIGYILGLPGLAGLAAGAGFFSYLAQRLINPLSPANVLQSGLPQTLKNMEHSTEGLLGLCGFLVLLGAWLILPATVRKKRKLSTEPAQTQNTDLPAETAPDTRLPRWANWLAFGLLICGLALRLFPLFSANWLQMETDYDEGVHLMAARLFFDGATPYRDYFFAQPPGLIYWLLPLNWLTATTLDFIWLGRVFWVVVWAGGSSWLVWLIGKRLGGMSAGLVALMALQLDGLGIFIGRQVMLEWPVNFFSLLAVWAVLKQFEQPATTPATRRWFKPEKWLIVAGIALALTVFTKFSGGLIGLALGFYLLVGRRFIWLGQLIFVTILTTLVVFIPTFWQSQLAGVRQFLFFQLLREPDGIARQDRFSSFSLDSRPYGIEAGSNLSVLVAVLGAASWFWLNRARPGRPGLGLVGIWASLTLLFFYYNSTFFVHYYVNLIPPLALLTAGLAGLFKRISWPKLAWSLLVAVFLLPAGATQFSTLLTAGSSPAPQYFGDFIRRVTVAQTTVQSFDVIYNLVAARKLPNNQGRYLIDSYGALQYEAYDLSGKSLGELLGMVGRGQKISANREAVIDSERAQTFLQQLFGTSGFVILDERGRDYVAGATEAALKTYSTQLVTNQILVAYANQLHSTRQMARQWLAANLPRGAKIWVEPGTLYLPGEFQTFAGTDTWRNPPEWYARQGYNYLLLSSENYGRFFEAQAKPGEATSGYQWLLSGGHLATFRSGISTTQPVPLAAEAERLDLIALPGAPALLSLPLEEIGATFGTALKLENLIVQRQATIGQPLALTINWRVLQPENRQPVKLFVHLLDKAGNKVAQRDTLLAVGSWPLKYWPGGSLILTEADLNLAADLFPGNYKLQLGLYYETDGVRLPVQTRQGITEGSLEIATIELTK